MVLGLNGARYILKKDTELYRQTKVALEQQRLMTDNSTNDMHAKIQDLNKAMDAMVELSMAAGRDRELDQELEVCRISNESMKKTIDRLRKITRKK